MVDDGTLGPVARVLLDVNLPHLDREFDYAVPPDFDLLAAPGARVRVRFAGRLVDGFVAARVAASDHDGQLAKIHKVTSSEPVLAPEVHRLLRAVADHYAGTMSDMLRLAIPPRHAATEAADRPTPPEPATTPSGANSLVGYPHGDSFVAALAGGRSPRAAWHVAAVRSDLGDPLAGLVAAAQATLISGRGAIILVPDQRTLQRLQAVVETICGKGTFAVLAAELGPSVRYRHFLAVARGRQQLVIGTRSAVYAPVRDLGFIGVWDDGSDQYAEQRAPYPHAREVAVLRATQAGAGLLFAAHARSVETQSWVESGWLGEIGFRPAELREVTPVVRVAGASDWQLERDPRAREARLPREVFDVVRAGFAAGPVLVQVPLTGYVRGACGECGTPATCPQCQGRVRGEPGRGGMRLTCAWCGPVPDPWRCAECGSSRVRAAGVGSARTAEELGRAFPGTRVVQSAGDRIVSEVSDEPALVVATPGGEPVAGAGYAAAVLLDAAATLSRPDLRAGEEALRRWSAAVALVRPAREGGTVLVVGPPGAMAIQALVRGDPAGFATRELVARREAEFPPASRLVVVEGPPSAVAELREELRLPAGAAVVAYLPPVSAEVAGATSRLTLRAPLAAGRQLVAEVKAAAAVRTARKNEGALRIRVDPQVLG